MSMSVDAARAFAARWLPAWTGSDPDRLVAFYAPDATYVDPAVPRGVHGREALREYFKKLLARNPDWEWTQREAIPMEAGFLNLWHAVIPLAGRTVEIDGACLVQFDDNGLIARNEVYFDRSILSLDSEAMLDETTGLPNRRLLLDRLARAMVRSDRDQDYGAVFTITLADARGVPLVSEKLQLLVRGRDTVARLDYDQLVIVAEGLGKGIDTALTNTERLTKKIREAVTACEATAKVGSAMFRGVEKEPARVLDESGGQRRDPA